MPVGFDREIYSFKPGMMVTCRNCIHQRLDLIREISKNKETVIEWLSGVVEGLEKFNYDDMYDRENFDTMKLAVLNDLLKTIKKIEKI